MTKAIPETAPDYDRTRIVERPDGYYWQATQRSAAGLTRSRA